MPVDSFVAWWPSLKHDLGTGLNVLDNKFLVTSVDCTRTSTSG